MEMIEYSIKDKDLQINVLNYGATITKIIYKGIDVALGYENLEDYFDNAASLGMSVMTNANRIADGEAVIDGKKYKLQKNDGKNNLHTHTVNSCQKKIYAISCENNKLICDIEMSDLQDGFPGNRKYRIIYELNNNRLIITYSCISDKKTIFNPTQHTYFNLHGHNKGTIVDHYLKINADRYTPTDDELIPTGKIESVISTPMDFRDYKLIGKDINDNFPALIYGKGYDNNWCLNGYDSTLKYCASLKADNILMNIYTTQPGLQVYTGNYLNGEIGKGNYAYGKNSGIALETQFYPDCCHHDNFIKSEIEANTTVIYKTIYEFEG